MLATLSEVGQRGDIFSHNIQCHKMQRKCTFEQSPLRITLESFKIPLRIKAVPETDVKYLRKTSRWKLEKF